MNRRTCLLALAGLVAGAATHKATLNAAESDSGPQVFELPARAGGRAAPLFTAIALSPDGTLLATAGDDHLVRLWRISDRKLLLTLRGHSDWVRTVGFSPDGEILASGGDDRTVRLWNVSSGQHARTLPDQTA
jgi:WD40 repeat protein